jgi:hypothetical protein
VKIGHPTTIGWVITVLDWAQPPEPSEVTESGTPLPSAAGETFQYGFKGARSAPCTTWRSCCWPWMCVCQPGPMRPTRARRDSRNALLAKRLTASALALPRMAAGRPCATPNAARHQLANRNAHQTAQL